MRGGTAGGGPRVTGDGEPERRMQVREHKGNRRRMKTVEM